MPLGPIFGAIGAAAGVTGAGVTAGASIAAGIGITTAAVGAGVGIASSAGAFSSSPSQINPNPTATASQTVDNSSTSNVNNLGRAALVMTSPQGVQGTDPVNRYALLGNSPSLKNSGGSVS